MGVPAGPWHIDDLLTFTVVTHKVDTGVLTDADSVPTYRVYEDETGTAILTGSMAKLDDTNTTGFYSEQLTLSAANGFENAKSYSIYISATVNSIVGGQTFNFKVDVPDVNVVAMASGVITATVIAADAIGASELAADAVAEIQSGLMLAASYTAPLSSAGTRSALGLASANLDTQLAAIAGYIDTEVAAILAAVDTEVAAIKTQTDKMVFTVANQLDVNVIDWKGSAAPAMTGDAFARLGAPAGASVSADIAAINTKIVEMWRKDGLDSANPSTVTPTTWTFGGISIAISGDGTTTSTFTRAP